MKKSVKITLIVAAALIVVGCGIGALAMWRMDWNLAEPQSAESHSESFDASVSAIQMDLKDWDVTVYRTQGDEITLIWWGTDANQMTADENGGQLELRQEYTIRTRKGWLNWYEWISFGDTTSHQVSLGIPDNYTGTLEIAAGTSTVTISELMLEQVSVQVGTGDIRLEDLTVSGGLNAETTTGSTTVKGLKVSGDLYVQATTGDIAVSDVTASGDLLAKTSTGSVNIRNSSARNIGMTCTTGDITVSGLDFQEGVSFKCTTGSVSGTLPGRLGDYTISSSTGTGDNSLPPSVTGGTKDLSAYTTTGDIVLKFEQ